YQFDLNFGLCRQSFVSFSLALSIFFLFFSCFLCFFIFFLIIRRTPTSTLFPYTTLFRSNFGMKMLTMTNLSTECLIQLTKLGYDATPFNQILKQNAKREMRLRLGKVTVADVLAAQPVTTNLLKFMRASIKM